jgi:hypothetical protein
MEEDWIVDRAQLRELMNKHPRLTQGELAYQVGRSVGWVKKWRQGDPRRKCGEFSNLHF